MMEYSTAMPSPRNDLVHDIEIRAAAPDDLSAILVIHNEVIATSTAIYSMDPATLDERRAWLRARTDAGFPVLVAIGDGIVAGSAAGSCRPCFHSRQRSAST